MKIVAYAWASGLIEFGKSCPDGALPVLVGDSKTVRSAVSVLARHSRTNDDLLVPGVPEAADPDTAVQALSTFAKRLREF
ncbi:host nuclease inhibitor protein [Apirhabdus apintestini]|nr:host nuclease inhibitor protein [Enterobacteriaceae bacterium CA-0114]